MLTKACRQTTIVFLSTRWFLSFETSFQILLAVSNAEHIARLVFMYDTVFIF